MGCRTFAALMLMLMLAPPSLAAPTDVQLYTQLMNTTDSTTAEDLQALIGDYLRQLVQDRWTDTGLPGTASRFQPLQDQVDQIAFAAARDIAFLPADKRPPAAIRWAKTFTEAEADVLIASALGLEPPGSYLALQPDKAASDAVITGPGNGLTFVVTDVVDTGSEGQHNGHADSGEWVTLTLGASNPTDTRWYSTSIWATVASGCGWLPNDGEIQLAEIPAGATRTNMGALSVYVSRECGPGATVEIDLKVVDTHRTPSDGMQYRLALPVHAPVGPGLAEPAYEADEPGSSDGDLRPIPLSVDRTFEFDISFQAVPGDTAAGRIGVGMSETAQALLKEPVALTHADTTLADGGGGTWRTVDDLDWRTIDQQTVFDGAAAQLAKASLLGDGGAAFPLAIDVALATRSLPPASPAFVPPPVTVGLIRQLFERNIRYTTRPVVPSGPMDDQESIPLDPPVGFQASLDPIQLAEDL
jgi:hypothetical protein